MIYNYYFAILILALIFFIISNKNVSILVSIIIIIIIGYFYFNKINEYNVDIKTSFNNKILKLNEDIKDKEHIIDDNNFIINKFPVELKYLNNDKKLIDLILKIRFIKLFDDARYTKIILLLEKFMKVYIFMLADRYDINNYFSTFLELRKTIIKELYSIYVVIPMKLTHIFNVNSFNTIKETINEFMKHSRKMIIIIENYGYKHKGLYYLEDTKYKAYEKNNLEVF